MFYIDEFYKIWMAYREKEWESDEFWGIKGYREGYSKIKGNLLPAFRRFIECVFSKEYDLDEWKYKKTIM